MWLLQSHKNVKIERLAATLPLPILQNSRRRHLQRFLALGSLNILALWFPLIREILERQIKAGTQLIIAIDRTQWKENNVLIKVSFFAGAKASRTASKTYCWFLTLKATLTQTTQLTQITHNTQ